MAKFPRLVTLNDDDESYQIWKEYFENTEDNFSEFVRAALFEEKKKRMDKDYIYNQLAEAENKVSFLKKELEKAEAFQVAKVQKVQAQQEETPENPERTLDVTARKIGMYLQYHFVCKELPAYNVWEFLAKQYLSLDCQQDIKVFLTSKGYIPKQIVKQEVTIA